MNAPQGERAKQRTHFLGFLGCSLALVFFLMPAFSGCVVHANQNAHNHGPHTAAHSHHHCYEKIKKVKRGKHKRKMRCHTHRHHDGHH